MRRNPDRTCWTCGKAILDRSVKSACYCKSCAEKRRQEYLSEYYKKAKNGLFQAAAGCLMYGIMVEQQESIERMTALSVMYGMNQKKNLIGGINNEAVEFV